MRLQLALNVSDLESAIAFYSKMFNAPVHKRKPGYANFAIDEPPLKLVFVRSSGRRAAPETTLVLKSSMMRQSTVPSIAWRHMRSITKSRKKPGAVTPPSARSGRMKPEGLRWEWYRILDDSDALFDGTPDARSGLVVPEPAIDGLLP